MIAKITSFGCFKFGPVLCATVVAGFWLTTDAFAARAKKKDAAPVTEEAKIDFKASDMLKKGLELLEMKQEERALKLISSVPRMFPNSKIRFDAYLALGKYYSEKRNYELAVKQFRQLDESEDPDQQAEGLYQTGICYYNLNNYDKAFMDLRRVTNEYPWSVYANEAYYYIGQCHFKQGRWSKAIEALEMVGTSVPVNVEGSTKAESGHRLYVKVFDKDLVVLMSQSRKLQVDVTTKGGDSEKMALEPLGRSGEYFIGSVATELGDPKPGDGKLQILGRDTVSVTYADENTEEGKINQKRISTIDMVSTASVGFTDGAYREYTKGVFGNQDCFIRVKDLDRDVSKERDLIKVRVYSQHKIEKQPGADDASKGVDLSTDEQTDRYEKRSEVEMSLTETEAHSGIFVGTIVPKVVQVDTDIHPADGVLYCMQGDEVVIEYMDDFQMASADPLEDTAKAKLLIGQIQDVKIEHRVVDSIELKARKNLIEAKIFLKLGQVFKEVGLTKNAADKAAEGLDRIEDLISTSMKASLDRSVVEEAFSVKWELLLVQDRLPEAIDVCRTLTQLFPDSTLVDKALLKIGLAKMETGNPEEAIQIFNSVVSLPKSDLKAEAQYSIGVVMENQAISRAREGEQPQLSAAMMAYKKCAEQYPDSPFAGEALDKIANYYITTKDYARAVELMESVFQDYPDASFLDKMLLKWVIASYRMGSYATAKQKAEQLLSEYPNSPLAEKARQFMDVINKKM